MLIGLKLLSLSTILNLIRIIFSTDFLNLDLCCPIWQPLDSLAVEHLKCGWFELRCALSVKYTLEFEVSMKQNVKYIISYFILITC